MAEEKRVYIYNQMGFFTGSAAADPSPLESDVYIMPPNSTMVKPPDAGEGETARWDGSRWALVTTQLDGDAVAVNKLKEFLSNNPDVAALLTK